MKKPAIQAPPLDPNRTRFDKAVKETIEIITGVRGDKIKPLEANAGLSDVIAKINEILSVLQ